MSTPHYPGFRDPRICTKLHRQFSNQRVPGVYPMGLHASTIQYRMCTRHTMSLIRFSHTLAAFNFNIQTIHLFECIEGTHLPGLPTWHMLLNVFRHLTMSNMNSRRSFSLTSVNYQEPANESPPHSTKSSR